MGKPENSYNLINISNRNRVLSITETLVKLKPHKEYILNKTVIALAILAASGSSFATDPVFSGSAAVSGAIRNSVTSSASVVGVGTSYSAAGSTAASSADAAFTTRGTHTTTDGVTTVTADSSVKGQTDTKVTGYSYNSSTGTGTGSATSTGWSDAGSNAHVTTTIQGMPGQTLSLSGASDSGRPNHANGSDVAMSVGTNQGTSAGAMSGGDYDATGNLTVKFGDGFVAGSVSDTKNASSYAGTGQAPIGNFSGTYVNATTLNASTMSNAGANGSFTMSTTTPGAFVPPADDSDDSDDSDS